MFLIIVNNFLMTVKIKYVIIITHILLIIDVFCFLFLIIQVYDLYHQKYQ